ncbi:MAG: hypothetical protein MEQ07_10115 [Aquimonas sp.]|nr:hypothetical protein [Aquimonas sp.]
MKWFVPAACLLAGAVAGWFAAGLNLKRTPSTDALPSEWVARIDGDYITSEMFIDEMRRRGGLRPGQYQDLAQKRALLDELLFRRAVIRAAREAGLDREPDLVRATEQLLVSSYLRQSLGELQQNVQISDADVRAHYEAEAERYAVAPRRRLAAIRIEPERDAAGELDWSAAEARAAGVLEQARTLPASIPHFGALAQEHSSDQNSRWRGGVIGWLAEQAEPLDGAGLDAAALGAGMAIEQTGGFAGPLRGADAIWLLRLVDRDAGRGRSFEELAAGIRQGLHQQQLAKMEADLRQRLLDDVDLQIREPVLAAIDPLGPPADTQPPQPPALPGERS